MDNKRITIFAGHYGSGKTNVAVNYSLYLRNKYPEKEISIGDIDIVNPYFRSKDSMEILKDNSIRLISSEFANSNVDLPAIPPETYALLDNKDMLGVIDVGGDDRGALALGRFAEKIAQENDYEMLFVINKYRPLTETPQAAIEIMKEIETACGLKFTAIVNNSNIGVLTKENHIISSFSYAEKVSALSGLPIKFTGAEKSLAESLKGKAENIFGMTLYVRQSFK
ncbi:MAG: hypothetical protein IJC89_06045 [Clostridia bacterium]|nr:hypothetical protein [Clostridia bacterium]